MTVRIKNKNEIEIMRQGGIILSGILEELAKKARIGVSTVELDTLAGDLCKKNNVRSAFLGYRNYPAVGCFGLNDTVVHGIPSKSEILSDGDILSIDMGIVLEEYCSDMAVTKGIGDINESAAKLISVTRQCLYNSIEKAVLGNKIGDISNAIQNTAEIAGFSVVREMVGHGIGKELHESPQIPGFGDKGQGLDLEEGMILAIEAIINEGAPGINFLEDGWTTKTMDGKLSALFEHTVLVTGKGPEILTKH
ncbi:MAG: type I methionyl aminopeptidase [Patescibacteria group bacterium]|nr:type I methionyl aminopeptidase [Patescibacteria group bacterium]